MASLTYIQHPVNLGQGAALQTGTQYAIEQDAEFIVHFDADGQHDAAQIEKLLQPLINNEADIVFGSRFLAGASTNISLFRKSILHMAQILNFIFCGIWLTDAHNGFRAMTLNAAKKIILTENRMAHASEILFLVKKNKLRFKEVPVSIRYTSYSKKKGQNLFNGIRIGFDLVLHKIFK